jgi:hypothetical protein
MNSLVVILNTQGRPIVEIAAAAKTNAPSSTWTTFHKLIFQQEPNEWSSLFHHGISNQTCQRLGISEQYAAQCFTAWVNEQIAQTRANHVTFLAPQDNQEEIAFVAKWRVVSCFYIFNPKMEVLKNCSSNFAFF